MSSIYYSYPSTSLPLCKVSVSTNDWRRCRQLELSLIPTLRVIALELKSVRQIQYSRIELPGSPDKVFWESLILISDDRQSLDGPHVILVHHLFWVEFFLVKLCYGYKCLGIVFRHLQLVETSREQSVRRCERLYSCIVASDIVWS